MEQSACPSYVNVPPIAKTRSTSHLAPTPEHNRSVSYEETTTASTSTDSVPGVRIRSESSQVSYDSPIPAPRLYVAAYEYEAQKDDELSLPLGSIVKLVTAETHEDGWFRGELEGKVGLFPSNYARLLPEKENLVEFTADEIQLPDTSKTLDDFRIGHGATATVFKVDIKIYNRSLQGGRIGDSWEQRKAALKRFNRYTFNSRGGNNNSEVNQLEQLKREANLVNGLSHNNIVRLIGICLEDPYFGLLLELCEGSSLRTVCRKIDSEKEVPLGVIIDWAGQVASGMEYLTKEGYVHRDLKADNVLVKEEVCYCLNETSDDWCRDCGNRPLGKLQLKITDFGVSRKMTADTNRFSSAGTYAWLAPEAFQNQIWSEASDVWSFGVVLWEVLSREEPYQGLMPYTVAFQVAMRGTSLAINASCPKKWKDIMQRCWDLNPSARPTFHEIVDYFKEYGREVAEITSHVQRAPSMMAVKEIYQECFIKNTTNEVEKMFHDLYSNVGNINRKNRGSIAPETKARKNKNHKGKKLEITGPMGEVKHILSVQLDKANDKNFKIKYNDNGSTGGTLPRLTGRQSTLSISSPDLFQMPEIVNGFSTVGHSASRISRQKAIRKKKSSHNAFESPIVSPTYDESTAFAKIETADEVDSVASKESKNGTFSKVLSKFHWKSHKRESKEDEKDDRAGSISSRSSSTTSSHRIIAGPASRSACAAPFLETGSRSRAASAADCLDDSSGGRRNKVSPSDKRPVKQTNLTERFVKEQVVRPSHLPSHHRKSALDQTIPASPSSPDSASNFQPMQLGSRRTTATSSTDGAPSYEMLVTNPSSQGVGHGQRNHVIQPSLSDYVPIAAEQPTHYLLKNGIIYDGNGHAHGSHAGLGHGKPTYYPVGGGCDDYIQVAGSGTVKPTVGEVHNSPYSDMAGHFYSRNVQNPQYVHCKQAPKPPLKAPSIPNKIQSESNLVASGMSTSRPEKLSGIGNSASSFSLNEPPDMPAPLPPTRMSPLAAAPLPPSRYPIPSLVPSPSSRLSMSPPTRLAPTLPPRDGSISPDPRKIMDREILKTNDGTAIF